MFPDAISRSILGWCGVALVLVATWFHGKGKGIEQGASRCDVIRTTEAPAEAAARCTDCSRDEPAEQVANQLPPTDLPHLRQDKS